MKEKKNQLEWLFTRKPSKKYENCRQNGVWAKVKETPNRETSLPCK